MNLVEWFSVHCLAVKSFNTKLFTGRTLRGLLIQMQNISLQSSGMHRKQNFEIVFGFKNDTAVLIVTFHFLSSRLLFLAFLASFFFLLKSQAVRRKDMDLHRRLQGAQG